MVVEFGIDDLLDWSILQIYDGVLRSLSGRATVFAGNVACPVVGRVSMDLITVDVTHLTEVPEVLELLGPHQAIDDLAEAAGTISYELLVRMAARLTRVYAEAAA